MYDRRRKNRLCNRKLYFKEIIGKLEKNGLIEHSILVSNSSQEREEVYTNLRDLNLEEKISYFSTILVNKEVKKEVKVG